MVDGVITAAAWWVSLVSTPSTPMLSAEATASLFALFGVYFEYDKKHNITKHFYFDLHASTQTLNTSIEYDRNTTPILYTNY